MRRLVSEIGILLLATLVRLPGLGSQALWMDEAFSHLLATLPLDTACQATIVDAVHPPFYYLVLRLWLALAGYSEFALRFPSVLAGVLTVALLLWSARGWLGDTAARWAALLLALSPFHVWYSQEARMYALLGLWALAVLVLFWKALHSRQPSVWVALAGVSALAYVTHYFALYLPLIEFVFLLATFRRHGRVMTRWTAAQALGALPLVAWLVVLYRGGGGTFGIGWIPRPQPVDLLETLWSFGMAYDGRWTALVWAGLLAWGGLVVLGAWRGRGPREARGLLALALVLPPLITYLISWRRPTYVDRFFVVSLPPFLLLAGAGLAHLGQRSRWVVGLAVVSLSLWSLSRFHSDPVFVKEDWRAAAAYIEAHEDTGDVLALRQFQHVVPLRYYYRGALKPVAVTLNQRTTAPERIAAGHDRLWLLFRCRHDDPHHLAWSAPFALERDETDPVVRDWVTRHSPARVVAFPGVVVLQFELRPEG